MTEGSIVLVGLECDFIKGQEILAQAVKILGEIVEIRAISSVIATQKSKLTSVLRLGVSLEPLELFGILSNVQVQMETLGPQKKFKMVLLGYGDQIIVTPRLTVPHPRLLEDPAFLVGSIELAPNAVHPILKQKLSEIFNERDSENLVEYVAQGKTLILVRDLLSVLFVGIFLMGLNFLSGCRTLPGGDRIDDIPKSLAVIAKSSIAIMPKGIRSRSSTNRDFRSQYFNPKNDSAKDFDPEKAPERAFILVNIYGDTKPYSLELAVHIERRVKGQYQDMGHYPDLTKKYYKQLREKLAESSEDGNLIDDFHPF